MDIKAPKAITIIITSIYIHSLSSIKVTTTKNYILNCKNIIFYTF